MFPFPRPHVPSCLGLSRCEEVMPGVMVAVITPPRGAGQENGRDGSPASRRRGAAEPAGLACLPECSQTNRGRPWGPSPSGPGSVARSRVHPQGGSVHFCSSRPSDTGFGTRGFQSSTPGLVPQLHLAGCATVGKLLQPLRAPGLSAAQWRQWCYELRRVAA